MLALREPGGTPAGEKIRGLVKDRDIPLAPWTELLLFEAARHQLVQEVIVPALQEGTIVILDRFYDSTTAYQGYGRGLDLQSVQRLHNLACGEIRPHITLLLDIEPRDGLKRVQGDELRDPNAHYQDRFEQEEQSFLQRVRQGFLKLAEEESERFIVLDAGLRMDDVGRKACTMLEERGF